MCAIPPWQGGPRSQDGRIPRSSARASVAAVAPVTRGQHNTQQLSAPEWNCCLGFADACIDVCVCARVCACSHLARYIDGSRGGGRRLRDRIELLYQSTLVNLRLVQRRAQRCNLLQQRFLCHQHQSFREHLELRYPCPNRCDPHKPTPQHTRTHPRTTNTPAAPACLSRLIHV